MAARSTKQTSRLTWSGGIFNLDFADDEWGGCYQQIHPSHLNSLRKLCIRMNDDKHGSCHDPRKGIPLLFVVFVTAQTESVE